MYGTKKASSRDFRSTGTNVKESSFQQRFKDRLKRKFRGIRVITKEAGSIRGLADLYGCYQGSHFELEMKKNEAESKKNTGRTVLQRAELHKCRLAGGFGEFVYPENADIIIDEMEKFFNARVSGNP